MDKVYHIIGFGVFWLIILVVIIVACVIMYWAINQYWIATIHNDRIMYYLGKRIDTKTLRLAYRYYDYEKQKKLVLKYRLRNIKKSKYGGKI